MYVCAMKYRQNAHFTNLALGVGGHCPNSDLAHSYLLVCVYWAVGGYLVWGRPTRASRGFTMGMFWMKKKTYNNHITDSIKKEKDKLQKYSQIMYIQRNHAFKRKYATKNVWLAYSENWGNYRKFLFIRWGRCWWWGIWWGSVNGELIDNNKKQNRDWTLLHCWSLLSCTTSNEVGLMEIISVYVITTNNLQANPHWIVII